MRAIGLLLLLLSACAVDLSTSEATQDLGSYCGGGYYPVACSPNGDWSFCSGTCNALDGEDGYCPEYSAAEYSYCARPENRNGPHCSNGQPQFTHYCVTGEFPRAPAGDVAP